MRFVRFGPQGAEKPGLLDQDGAIRDLSAHVPDLAGPVLGDLGSLARHADALPVVREAVRLGSPVGGVGKFMCIGLNYSDHAEEAGMAVPDEPILFMKATSAICGPHDPIMMPLSGEKLDWELELAVIIGKTAKNVPHDKALEHVAGYTIANDVSERRFQIEGTGQWTKGKSCDTFGPLGPWLVTPEEIPDPQNLTMSLQVNGDIMQRGSTSTMVFGVAYLIAYMSRLMTLHPGDVIATGTPPGVGMGLKPPRYLKVGDSLSLTIEGLGMQSQSVIPYG